MEWFGFHCGPDWTRGPDHWCASFAFIRRPDLMTRPGDWGMSILCALHVEVNIRVHGARSLWSIFNAPLIRVWFRSDADEIAKRIARQAGQ